MKKTKLFAFALALTLAAVPLNGCGFQKEGETLELTMDNSWRSEQFLNNFRYDIFHYTDGDYLYCSDYNAVSGSWYCRYNIETGEKIEFETKIKQEGGFKSPERLSTRVMQMPDGRFGIWVQVEQGIGGGKTEIHKQMFEIYDEHMNCVETREIPLDFGKSELDEQDSIAKNEIMDGKGNWIIWRSNWQTGELWIDSYNSNFEHLGSIDYSISSAWNGGHPGMFTDANGTVYMTITCGTYGEYYEKIYRLDAEKRTCEDTGINIPFDGDYGASGFVAGTQGYDYYYATYYGLFGVKDDERTKVIDWINSDFMPGDIQKVQPLDDGRFILYSDRKMYLANPRTQEEIDSTKIISLASVEHSDDLLKAVIDYNREESGYRIIIKDYSEYNTVEDPELGYTTMKQDMLDGKVADIICPDGVNFESLASKGLFADWYDFMDADEAFSRDNYLQNYFETMETDDKLLRLGFSYVIETGTAKTEFAGEKQGLPLGDQLTLAEASGIDAFRFDPAERFADTWMRNLQTGCIDRRTAKCWFDSPEFVAFLELLAGLEQGEKFYEAVEAGKYQGLRENFPYRADAIFLNTEPITQPIDIRAIRRYTFYDADITLTGYPMIHAEGVDHGNGGIFHPVFTICINAQSSEHEAIWDFMKFFLTEDYQKHLTESMPIHKKALEYKYEEAEGMVTATVGMFPNTSFIGELETWESAVLRDYVDGIRTCWYFDTQIHNILMEEVEKLLAGDQTAQECAEMMQSRVSIYLSEQS